VVQVGKGDAMATENEQNLEQDIKFLKRTLELAETGIAHEDGGPFGAVIAKNGQIISEGWNRVVASHDPTAHAEIIAIRQASEKLKAFHLAGCTLYASSEPCPMCLAAAHWARVDRIVFINSRLEAAKAGFSDESLYAEFALPIAERQIPTQHISIDGANDVFAKWAASNAKVLY
jgi:tRNA(Arg) A34 adenosine deaminase TadA